MSISIDPSFLFKHDNSLTLIEKLLTGRVNISHPLTSTGKSPDIVFGQMS